MKAAVVRALGEPLAIGERPDPEPGPGRVRIRVEASGLCHTDTHAAHGDRPVRPSPPFVPGLGHLALQYAKIAGARVAAVDVTDERRELAAERGADLVIDARKDDVGEVLERYGGAHATLALAANETAFAALNSGLRRGGRLVMVALPAHGTLPVPVFDTVLKGTSVTGSIVGTRQDLAEVFRPHAAGRTRAIRETRPLTSVNESIEDVLGGRVRARIVSDLAAEG